MIRNPVRPKEVAEGVYQLGAVAAGVTAIRFEDQVLLVDAGGRGSPVLIKAGLKALGVALEQVQLILLTHSHPDHTGGLAALVRATGAKVAAHSSDASIIEGTESLRNPFRNRVMSRASGVVTRLYGAAVAVDFKLEDGDRLAVGGEIRVIHTPGHTPGSICLYLPAKKLVIVGDALQLKAGRVAPPASGVTGDFRQAMESLRRLENLDFETICFSHFPVCRDNPREQLRRLVRETPT